MPLILDIFTHLLPHARVAELEERYRADDEENDDGDGRREAVIDPARAGESQVIHIADQDVGMPGRGRRSGDGRPTRVEQVDDVEVVEVEGKRGRRSSRTRSATR